MSADVNKHVNKMLIGSYAFIIAHIKSPFHHYLWCVWPNKILNLGKQLTFSDLQCLVPLSFYILSLPFQNYLSQFYLVSSPCRSKLNPNMSENFQKSAAKFNCRALKVVCTEY